MTQTYASQSLEEVTKRKVGCRCARAIDDEIRAKGFPYLSPMMVMECEYGKSAELSFVESLGSILEHVKKCNSRAR